ncbi:MAG: hypothetical protein HN729_07860 [Candidatus Marinimicrobia bacterium]|mgnify:FL=1|jgi:hypothetical protein|nr:hypothetical protein [Candidatus Neomarinimicrobiota bacterium]MBT3633054.1 hypothetical protein [Candidatus Neomarinimicrobiota bacterium]MBT3683504.1 hypothetical protein [Candidatus Neomarinimicrobiota bacterium]MBT3758654.1 hypothetical protein [Candidatus Neomarinimicrobiota bacterium]MBT3896437.1 hypothetical protein [Candidatus Neomarinimicrobiota bacterium]
MKTFIKFIKDNPKTILTLISIAIGVVLMLRFGVDKKAVAIVTLIVGFMTNAFAGVVALITMVPIIGPLIIKVLTIPFFWLLNAMGYFTSAYAIKKGYGKDVMTHRLIVITLLIGIVLGYILGHLIPVR